MDQQLLDRLAIRDLVENWAVWRDAGDWERFATVWHDEGWMSATWFQGPGLRLHAGEPGGFGQGRAGSCISSAASASISQATGRSRRPR